MTDSNTNDFHSVAQLFGDKAHLKVINSHILIVGIGGIGSWVAESLARSGVGKITLVDMDDICASNINRQVHALKSTIGRSKVDEMKSRILLINPNCEVNAISDFFTITTADNILEASYDYVVDAIDSLKNKCLLIAMCKKLSIPIITTGGAGGRSDAAQIKIEDLNRSYNDPLLYRVRKSLRSDYGFTRYERKKFHVTCVYSSEKVKRDTEIGESNIRRSCNNGLGTASFITATFGMFAASHIINSLATNES